MSCSTTELKRQLVIQQRKTHPCLYRNPSSRLYYAPVKIDGKQIKRSLMTNNLARTLGASSKISVEIWHESIRSPANAYRSL